ncbi:MAG: hypothetical protein OXF25_08030 [Cyanobacteria bacterium MAG CAR3_bin_5]|nr:hypothetical protein [Cyanobacteria bacterium MAG CAR3_bin_5]
MNRSLAQLLAAPTVAGMLFLTPAGIAQVSPAKPITWDPSSLIGGVGGGVGGVILMYFVLLKETKAKVENIEKDIAKLNQEGIGNLKADLKDEIGSLKSTTQEVKSDLEDQVKDVNSTIREIKQFVPEINKVYEQFDSKIATNLNLLSTTVKRELTEIDSKFSDKISNLKENIKNRLDTNQEKLENQITRLRTSTQKLSNDQIPELKKIVSSIKNNVQDIETDINSLKGRLDTLDT